MTVRLDLRSQIAEAQLELAEAIRLRDEPAMRVRLAEQELARLRRDAEAQEKADRAEAIAGCPGLQALLDDAAWWIDDAAAYYYSHAGEDCATERFDEMIRRGRVAGETRSLIGPDLDVARERKRLGIPARPPAKPAGRYPMTLGFGAA